MPRIQGIIRFEEELDNDINEDQSVNNDTKLNEDKRSRGYGKNWTVVKLCVSIEELTSNWPNKDEYLVKTVFIFNRK
jgi:hypothetical protein